MPSTHALRKVAPVAAIVALALLPVCVQSIMLSRTDFLFDFGVFYCAGHVVVEGGDPYRADPLRSCEHSVIPGLSDNRNANLANLVAPAPLPGYAIAVFVPLSLLPFVNAAALWLTILLLAWLACIIALVRFADVRWQIPLAALALSVGATSIPLAQIVPVAIAAICVAGYFAWRGRWRAAAIAAATAMIEPHLGLPVVIALAVWVPATRVTLALLCGSLAAVSLVVLSPATNLEYFTSVLPAHVLSEAGRDSQIQSYADPHFDWHDGYCRRSSWFDMVRRDARCRHDSRWASRS